MPYPLKVCLGVRRWPSDGQLVKSTILCHRHARVRIAIALPPGVKFKSLKIQGLTVSSNCYNWAAIWLIGFTHRLIQYSGFRVTVQTYGECESAARTLED